MYFCLKKSLFLLSSVSSSSEISYLVSLPSNCQPLESRHHSFNSLPSFLIDCVVIKLLSPKLLNLRLASDDRPASVHMTNLESSKSFIICFSRGLSESCSFCAPGLMQKARGIPDLSINRPICTIGLGRCSLLTPYCLSPDSCSNSKKKFVQS